VWDPNEPENGVVTGDGYVINGESGIEDNVAPLLLYIKQKTEQYKNSVGYYPTQIDIVAHSMGGLIVRSALGSSDHFSFANPSFTLKVGKVVMLAPPNCGSPVADWVTGMSASAPGDDLVAAALPLWDKNWTSVRDLTTSNMRSYNASHPWPSVPLYLLSAGDPWAGFGKTLPNGVPDNCWLTLKSLTLST